MNQDFKELLHTLNGANARFLVVGAYAVVYYTEPRYTKDLDLWVEGTPDNAKRVLQALVAFGAPTEGLTVEDLCQPAVIYQIGIEPNRVDILVSVEGLRFDEAWSCRVATTYGGERVFLLSLDHLIAAKRAAGRPQDLLDMERLERARVRRST